MFWHRYWELYSLTFGAVIPCYQCRMYPAEDCGFCERTFDYWSGTYEAECMHPDWEEEQLECENCPHLICKHCNKETQKT